MKSLTIEQLNWIGENINLFIHTTSIKENQRNYIYSMYNHVTGETKKPNGCGRCWLNTKKTVFDQYKKQTNIF